MVGEVPQAEIAGKQRGRDHKAKGSDKAAFAGYDAALGQCHDGKHGGRVKQQHRGGRLQSRSIALMGRDGGQDDKDTKGAHQRSPSSRTIAARSSGIPAAVSEDVASTSGKAAGCVESEVLISPMRCSMSAGLI